MTALLGARRGVWPWVVAGALVALIPSLGMFGFTVDDALIAVRYAHNLASGAGWRFDADGSSTDGVTPLPWPLVLAPLARPGLLGVLLRAQLLGLCVWVVTGAGLGAAFGAEKRSPVWYRGGALAALALSVPVAAYAIAGLETPLATCLATWAVLTRARPLRTALLAGLAASIRPELGPWAFVLATGVSLEARKAAITLASGALALLPFAVCAAVRACVWGNPAPLAVLAKPGLVSQGLAYAGAACFVTVTPVLLLAPRCLRRGSRAMPIAAAAGAHWAAVVLVGGDWMPFARLMVPIVPGLAFAGVDTSTCARPRASAVRLGASLALGVALLVANRRVVTDARHVGPDRAALVASARPALAGLAHVAALDVGWLGAASEADIVDLAGLTDPEIASLPGGHTSKRVDARLLSARHVDALLLYAPAGLPSGELERYGEATYSRFVEYRLAHDTTIATRFVPSAWLPLGARGAGYVLLRARVP